MPKKKATAKAVPAVPGGLPKDHGWSARSVQAALLAARKRLEKLAEARARGISRDAGRDDFAA